MKSIWGLLKTALVSGALLFGTGAVVSAQQAPPASQQPMEIPVQYSPEGQGRSAPSSPSSQNDAGAARISFVRGDVSTQHDGSSDWAAATVNTPVVNGDHISTGPNARVEIQLDHANILRLSDRSTANVASLAGNPMQIQIGQGLANYEVLKNNDASIEIQTPNVAIHPEMGEGSYRILVNSDGETIIDVRKGSAEISTPQGSTRVERDQRITIQGNADSAQYQVSGAPGRDDWDKWNSDRDHVIESADSWHHTNPYYTGSQDLDTYGRWRDVPDYGEVWFPNDGPDWAPYRDGRWVYEPYYGWTWVSYEPWGWAPYHYGRWFVYGGNWGWWPGPVYGGYRPLWAPAYVSFFGFGGGGWGVNVGFGFGGYGNVGWLPCGPGDRFYPWYGRGVGRVNEVNIYNARDYRGGIGPLRDGPRAFSNVDRAFSDAHVRGGISSMRGNDFGRGRVSMQQSRIDPGSLRQASMMTGAHPVSPSRQSYQPSDRQVNPSAIQSRVGNQRFFNPASRQNSTFQGGRGDGNFNRGGNPAGNPSGARGYDQSARPGQTGNSGQRGYSGPSSQQGQPVESSRPGWRTFNPPAGRQTQSDGNGRQPNRNDSRGGYNNGSNRPTLDMQQPVVTPRGGGSYSGGGNATPRGDQGNRGSYTGRSMPNAPTDRNNGGGGYRGGPPEGGAYSSRPRPSAPSERGNGGGGYRGGPPEGGAYSGRPVPSAPSERGNGGGGYRGGAPDRGPYSGRPMPSAPSERGNGGGGGYRGGGQPSGGSYPGRSMPSAPSGGYGGGGSRGGSSNGGSHGGNSGGGSRGGSSGGDHGHH